jgi:hypothetical protein
MTKDQTKKDGGVRRRAPWFGIRACVFVILWSSVIGHWSFLPAEQREEPGEAPLEPKRVLLMPERLPTLLDRVGRGTLVKMPLAEFEQRLREARAAWKRPAFPSPHLASARYRAALVEAPPGADSKRGHAEPYLKGTGQWQILSPGPAPGVLSLEPLSLALGPLRFENRDALAGAFTRRGVGLLLDRAGEQSVMFDWTARGDQTPDGLHFDWRVPPAPVALLELDLPAGRGVSVTPETTLVTGPRPAESAGRSLWTIRFAGRSVLHLTVAPPLDSGPGPSGALLVEQVRGQHTLAPEGEDSDFTFDVRVVSRGVSSLTFACDAPLTPYRVTLPADSPARLEGWDVEPAKRPGERSRLTLRLRQAVAGTLQPRIFCRAGPLPQSGRQWSCPGLYLRPGSVPRSESIEIRCRPGLRLEDWHPGAFRLVGTETEADGTYRLSLASTGLPTGPGLARPGARLRTHEVDYRARVLTWWQVGASSTLTAQITYDVRHGRLFELPLLVPAGWVVERVWCSGPPERLRNWTVGDGRLDRKPARLVTVELQTPLETANKESGVPTLFVRLRDNRPPTPLPAGERGGGPGATELPFPVVVPSGGAVPDGGLGVDWDDELFAASFTTAHVNRAARVALAPGRPPLDGGPWGRRAPRAYFSWDRRPPPGLLQLRPRPARLRTHSLNELHLSPGRLDLSSRLTLGVETGAIGAVEVRSSAPLPRGAAALRWEAPLGGPRVRAFERLSGPSAPAALAALASASPLGSAALLNASPLAEYWRLTLARPLRAHQTLILRARRLLRWPPASATAPWPVSLVTLAGPGEVRLFLPQGGSLTPGGLRSTGLRQAADGAVADNGLAPAQVFLHDTAEVSLALAGVADTAGPGWQQQGTHAGAVLPRAALLTRAEPGGRLVHLYTFEVRDWPQPTLPLRLPPGARLAALRVDGRDATGSLPHPVATADGDEVALPVPAGAGKPDIHYFEVLYVTEQAPWRLWARLEATAPATPLRPLALRRLWRLPGAYVPLTQGGVLRLPAAVASGGLARLLPSPERLAAQAFSLDHWGHRQEQAVRAADAAFRRSAAGRERTLAAALEALSAAILAEEGGPLVVDTLALRAAGLSPDRTFLVGAGPRPAAAGPEQAGPPLASLEPLGLICVLFRRAAVLTTLRQGRDWQQLHRGSSVTETGPLADAAAEAAGHGHDASGRFRTVTDWLDARPQRGGPRAAAGGEGDSLLETLPPADALVSWTDWEEMTAASPGAPLRVVRASLPAGLGLGLAGVLLLVAWLVGRAAGPREWKEGDPAGPGPARRRGPLALILLWLGGAGLGYLWLPAGLRDLAWWPLTVGSAVALWWYIAPRANSPRALSKAPSTRPSVPVGMGTAGVLALFWTAWAAGPAQERAPKKLPLADRILAQPAGKPEAGTRLRPEDLTVYLIPGSSLKQTPYVLVAPALLERLARRPQPLVLPGATLVAAEYRGSVKRSGDRSARFEAVLQVYCPAAGPATLELPLAGVVLLPDPLLDGARVPLTPTPAGFALKVAGAGLHKVQLSFTTDVNPLAPPLPRGARGGEGGEAFETRFTVPCVAQSRLSLRLPPGSAFPQVLVKLGSQRVTDDPAGPLLEADIGAFNPSGGAVPLHLRWRSTVAAPPGKAGARPIIRFREAYLWDLGGRGHSLLGVLRFQVESGSTARLSVDVPRGLLVSRVEARQPAPLTPPPTGERGRGEGEPPPGDGPPAVRLREWRLTPAQQGPKGKRRLDLEFHTPVSGEVQVLLVLYPSDGMFDSPMPARPVGGRPTRVPATVTLPLPRPHGEPVAKEGYLAYRLHGFDAQRIQPLRIIGIEVKDFPSFFWQAAGRPERPPDYACRIERVGKQGPVLPLELRQARPQRQGKLWLGWQLGGAGAELSATLELKAAESDLALVEFEVPAPVEVTAVRGPELREWSWTGRPGGGGRIQAWLRRSAAQARLELTARASSGGQRKQARGPGASLLFDLPALRVADMEGDSLVTTVELTAGDGLELTPQGVRRLKLQRPGNAGPAYRLVYTADGQDYRGRFAIGRARLPAVKVVTTVAVEGRQLRFRARIKASLPGGVVRSLGLRLTGWPGSKVALEAPGAVQRTEARGASPQAARLWQVDWEKDTPSALLTLSGQVSLEEAFTARRPDATAPRAGLPIPGVEVLGAATVERWLVLSAAGRQLSAGGVWLPAVGYCRQVSGHKEGPLLLWPLADRRAPKAEGGVQVVLTEHVAAVLDGRRWLHQATWWLHHDTPAQLTFTLPEGVLIVGASVDGRELRLAAGKPQSTLLDLHSSGARRVRLCWTAPADKESLARPLLEGPRLEGVARAGGPVTWSLHVPPGFHAAPGSFRSGTLAAARREVEQARAQFRLSKLLLESAARRMTRKADEQADEQLTVCQRRFARHAHAASQLLLGAGPAGKDLAGQLEGLRRDNRSLTDAHGLGALRRQAQRNWRQDSAGDTTWSIEELVEAGRPFYRVQGAREPVQPVAAPSLASRAEREQRRALAATGLLVGLLLAVWILSSFPSFVSLTHLFWPEQVVLLGLFGYQTFGLTWLVLFLLALGVVARLLALATGALRFLRRVAANSREAAAHTPRPRPGGGEQHG